MWHVSVSVQRGGEFVLRPSLCESIAVELLAGVGGDREWWLAVGEQNPAVAHLRVPTTPVEQRLIPAGLVTMDAGAVGPMRARTVQGLARNV